MTGKPTYKPNPHDAHPGLGRYWLITDGGRATSDRGRTKRGVQRAERNDCAVRALVAAVGLTYDEAHRFCEQTCGRERGKGCHITKPLRAAASKGTLFCGKRVRWVALPAVAGQPRTDAYALLHSGVLAGKRAIVREAGHVYGVVDGIAHDTCQPYAGRCVYGYWLLD